MNFKFSFFLIISLILLNRSNGQRVFNCEVKQNDLCIFYFVNLIKTEVAEFRALEQTPESIMKVKLEYSSLHTVPKNFFKKFVHLESLNMWNCMIDTLEDYPFADSSKSLINLNLEANSIRKLEENVFRGAENLIVLQLNLNQISEIDKNAFKSVRKLEILELSHNEIKEIHADTFRKLRNLQKIHLNNNQLQHLPEKLFSNNFKLKAIYLYSNRISHMSSTMFSHLTNLQHLWINENPCTNGMPYLNAWKTIKTVEKDLQSCET